MKRHALTGRNIAYIFRVDTDWFGPATHLCDKKTVFEGALMQIPYHESVI